MSRATSQETHYRRAGQATETADVAASLVRQQLRFDSSWRSPLRQRSCQRSSSFAGMMTGKQRARSLPPAVTPPRHASHLRIDTHRCAPARARRGRARHAPTLHPQVLGSPRLTRRYARGRHGGPPAHRASQPRRPAASAQCARARARWRASAAALSRCCSASRTARFFPASAHAPRALRAAACRGYARAQPAQAGLASGHLTRASRTPPGAAASMAPATPVLGSAGLAFCGWSLMLAGIAKLQARRARAVCCLIARARSHAFIAHEAARL